ncbi:hypothetical protein [Roseateles albus]|uniref:Helix-turn-helix domain-containing protein n=1 Tax=Roseateles albus TaxID=2987525 RepID=A0ABT5K9M4_9BURK|nr:hypothetical protein [Roseateles albus]MDC8770651.1 hypothetical protein [Roseateles albus]
MKNARLPKNGKTSACEQGNSKPGKFLGTDNQRHLRVIQALLTRPMPREHVDSVAGCSNGPELIAELRRRGLSIPCTRAKKKDRDLFDCFPGVYHLTHSDRRKLTAWMRERAKEGLS